MYLKVKIRKLFAAYEHVKTLTRTSFVSGVMVRGVLLLIASISIIKIANLRMAFSNHLIRYPSGSGVSTVEVCNEDELTAAASDDIPRIVRVVCEIILQNRILFGSNKSILGGTTGAGVSGHGFNIQHKKNFTFVVPLLPLTELQLIIRQTSGLIKTNFIRVCSTMKITTTDLWTLSEVPIT